MNLMNVVRLCAAMALAWTLLALGIGVMRKSTPTQIDASFFLPQPALHDAVAISKAGMPGREEYRLVDRSTGRAEPFPLPDDESWSCVSVSPWRDPDGNLEAVGRWNRVNSEDHQAFCGLGLFRVSKPTVVHRIDLDVLPTGRPCWIPDRPGDFLFPAGDGRLYRCHLSRDGDDPGTASDRQASGSERLASARPVTWRCKAPGSGTTFISDPVWPFEKELRRFVFVSLSVQSRVKQKLHYEPSQIWWLELSEGGYEIVSAGQLTEGGQTQARAGRPGFMRMPNVTVGPSGRLTLAYLTRSCGETSWKLCSAAISLSPTGEPTIARAPEPTALVAIDLLPVPPSFSTDGRAIFASAEGGRIKKYALPR